MQISVTASRQQRVSALLIVTIPTHQSSKKRTKGNNRHLYMLRRYQLNMAEISKITLMPDEQTCTCHNPECGKMAHIDHALAPNKDAKAHWVVDDADQHFCSLECKELMHDEIPLVSKLCRCIACIESHDSFYLGTSPVPGPVSGRFDPDSLGQCDLDGCLVCERRGTTVIPHTRCAHVGHDPMTVFDKSCWQCKADAMIAEIRKAHPYRSQRKWG